MESLILEPKQDSPNIVFDFNNNILELRGESYMENAKDFYAPIFSCLDTYLTQIGDAPVTMNIHLLYFNTSSAKILLDIFELMDNAAEGGKQITVNWIYNKDDSDSLEFGEEFQDGIESLTFNLVENKN